MFALRISLRLMLIRGQPIIQKERGGGRPPRRAMVGFAPSDQFLYYAKKGLHRSPFFYFLRCCFRRRWGRRRSSMREPVP